MRLDPQYVQNRLQPQIPNYTFTLGGLVWVVTRKQFFSASGGIRIVYTIVRAPNSAAPIGTIDWSKVQM
jgi:hypothetical protein